MLHLFLKSRYPLQINFKRPLPLKIACSSQRTTIGMKKVAEILRTPFLNKNNTNICYRNARNDKHFRDANGATIFEKVSKNLRALFVARNVC